ncbi:MAG: ankyrin repeat domain-containing protein [Nitrospinota bacterium]|nr:ankyrin repeat domain-containing protein [Nitrospinota bacterium]
MKKFLKIFGLLIGLYIVVWFTLSGTEAGVLTLQIGAKQNSPFLTRVFTALGANPKETGQDGMSALHFAGYLGADQVIPILVEKGAPIDLRDKEGRTALHLAAYAGQASAVAALLDHKADPEIKENTGGMTALHLAVAQKHSEAVQVILDKGANASPEEKNGYTPLFIAEHEDLGDIVDILKKYDAH